MAGGDVLRFEGVSGAASFTYLRDMGGVTYLHADRLADGAASATPIVSHAGNATLVAGDFASA
ncbi:hypothetical protein ACFQS7_22585 [Dankookia sp. GCM10030260]|uniref:hypothetical protein n=1 Tax=Dankookia sp. GCM10030260 TaxID=3273390 RepID=UPI00360DFEF6